MELKLKIAGIIRRFTCGFCLSQGGYDVLFADYSLNRPLESWGDITQSIAIGVLKCKKCEMLSIVRLRVEDQDYPDIARDDFELAKINSNPYVLSFSYDKASSEIWPQFLVYIGQYPFGKHFIDEVPEGVREDLIEAHNCLFIGATNAVVVMCRRVIENIGKYYGINEKTLHNTLQALKASRKIDEKLYDSLMEIKAWGNLGAHSADGESSQIYFSESKEVLELVTQTVDYIFTKQMIEDTTKRLSNRRNQKNT